MNILANTDQQGGMPAKLNDWRWVAAGLSEALRGILSPFDVSSNHTFILSGCTRSVASGTVTIQEGFISIGGEVCYVPFHTYPVPTGGDVEYFAVDVSYDPEGQKAFKNPPIPTLVETYEIRIGKIVVAASVPSGYTLLSSVKRYPQLINDFITEQTVNSLVTEDTVNDFVLDSTVNSLIDGSLINSMITSTTVNSLVDLAAINTSASVYTIKTGMVMMWSGSIATIPSGYCPCDGRELEVSLYPVLYSKLGYLHGGSGGLFKVPDLRSQFVVGYSGSGDYNTIGNSGGQSSFTISEDNLPEHNHTFTGNELPSHSHDSISGTDTSGANQEIARIANASDSNPVHSNYVSAGTPSGTISMGGGVSDPEAVDNRPPYYVLAFIIKV